MPPLFFRISNTDVPFVARPEELRPIAMPKTFLDVNYNDDEENDLDYRPEVEDQALDLLSDSVIPVFQNKTEIS